MSKGARIDLYNGEDGKSLRYCYTNTYILHCGDAGIGKGVVEDLSWEILGGEMPSIAFVGSQEMLMQHLEDYDGRGLIQLLDEWPVFWKFLKNDPSQGYMLTAYLRAFRQQPVELAYLKKSYKADLPLLSVMGFAQSKRLFEVLQPEDYSNGFVRRHIITFSPAVKYTMADQCRYDPQVVADSLRKSGVMRIWKEHLASAPLHKDYTISKGATESIRYWVLKHGIEIGLESGYITTMLYQARKFALIYHLLLGEAGTEISKETASYACALTQLCMHDLQYLMDKGRRSALSRMVEDAAKIKTRIEAGELKGPWNHRVLQQKMHIPDSSTARLVWDLCNQAGEGEEEGGSSVIDFPTDKAG